MKVVETDGLTKRYGRSAPAIQDLCYSLEEGEIHGLVGPNGAGKTTTIRLLLNFIWPTSGRASVFGMDATRDSKTIKRAVGYVPAEDSFDGNPTVEAMLREAARFRGMEARGMKRAAECAEVLDLDLGLRVRQLSKGNQRKASILRSMLHDPRLLILDEPTNGLDPLAQTRFLDLVKEANRRGAAVLFSSHVLTDVEAVCDRVTILREGRIVGEVTAHDAPGNQPLHVRVDYRRTGATFCPWLPNMPGVTEIDGTRVDAADGCVRFVFRGAIGDLMERMVRTNEHQRILDLRVERRSLKDRFLSLYEPGGRK